MDPDLDPPTPVTTRTEELNEILVGFLGSRNVYFQPDQDIKMAYPAIVYQVDDQYAIYSNNAPYHRKDRYLLTLIDRDPDVPVRRKIETMNASFVRADVIGGLSHRYYSLYF
jgi:hypothetical protein